MGENTSDNPESSRDDLTIDTRGQTTANGPRPTPQPVPAQFGLRGLLWFMLACSAYFAQLAVVLHAEQLHTGRSGSGVLALLVGWLLLGAFYVRIRFRRALVIHCFAPAIVLVFLFLGFVLMLDAGQLPDARNIRGPSKPWRFAASSAACSACPATS